MAQAIIDTARPPQHRAALKSALLGPLSALASLRLTVVLLAMSIILVFVGTLAQIDGGIWTIVSKYFRSFVVIVPMQLLVQLGQVFVGLPAHWRLPDWVAVPFPGGWTLGGLLLANLLAAHAVRFRTTWKRAGVMMLHAGLVTLMLGELVTGLFQVEARMTIGHGEAVNFTENSREVELAIVDTSNPAEDVEVAIPQALLTPGNVIRHSDLPVDVEVVDYLKNAELVQSRGDAAGREVFTSKSGLNFVLMSKDEASGVEVGSHEDAATARIKLRRKNGGPEVAARTVSLWFSPNFTRRQAAFRMAPQGFELDGKTYRVELRGRRDYKTYALRLDEFRFDRYPGTQIARNYSSRVRLLDGSNTDGREVIIRMNEPLTYGGETFYQSSFTDDEAGTILQATRNPGVWLPYIACTLVIVGMAWHFGLHLVGFLRRAPA